MKNKNLKIIHILILATVFLGGVFVADSALAAFSAYKPFGGRILFTPTTPTINCYGSTGDITTSGTFGQSTLLVIPPGTRMGREASAGKWILGLHMPSTTPSCTIGEAPYMTTYSVYNVVLYGVSRGF